MENYVLVKYYRYPLDTLNKYINKLDSTFGFSKTIFDTLRLKASRMEANLRRGTLLIDEITLSESVRLNSKTMEFNGSVNFGDYTPEHYCNERADHALVFMYQPFQDNWVQVLGYFLSKISVTKDILDKLIIDCSIQLKNACFKVDVVTSNYSLAPAARRVGSVALPAKWRGFSE